MKNIYKTLKSLFIVLITLTLLSTSCKKDEHNEPEVLQNMPPVIVSLTGDQVNPIWNSSCQLSVVANDPEGLALTYSWTSTSGEYITPTNNSVVTWKCPMSSGTHNCTVYVSDGSNTVSQTIAVNVSAPSNYFVEDFSAGTNYWFFGGCNYTISNGKLQLISTDYTAQARAQTYNFSPFVSAPWTLIGEMAILSYTSKRTDNGISVRLRDVGNFAIEHLWFSVRKNSSAANWIWLMWIPSLNNGWLPWDASCYGISSNVYTDSRTNILEMSASINKQFTLKANGYVLSSYNNSINELQNMGGVYVNLDVEYIKLRGGNKTTTHWDNIFFYSENPQKSVFQTNSVPSPPSDEYVDGILTKLEEGEDISLKSLLLKKINSQISEPE